MSGGTVSELKLKNNVPALLEILENGQDWMLSLDAAEALAQLGDKRGIDRLINALSDSDNDIRDVAREILEAINNPQGNQALLQLCESTDILSNPVKQITRSTTFRISEHPEAIKFLSFLVPPIITMLVFFYYSCREIGHWSCLFALPLVGFFPLGMFEIPGIIFHKMGFAEQFYVDNDLFVAFVVGWLIYFLLMMFGAKTKKPFVFAIIYILFILLFLGNIYGCTIQISSLNGFVA